MMVTRACDVGASAREIAHTADVGLEVEAPSLPVLFERAGLAMLALVVDLSKVEPREESVVAVEADGTQELLRDWLQALLVGVDARGFVASELAVDALGAAAVRGVARGEHLDPVRHRFRGELKGVTYHQLAVRETAHGWSARVIFDV